MAEAARRHGALALAAKLLAAADQQDAGGAGRSSQMFFAVQSRPPYGLRDVDRRHVRPYANAWSRLAYTDVNFPIPEPVERLEYRKRAYYAEVEGFSSAGTAYMSTYRRLDEGLVKAGHTVPFCERTTGD